MSNNKLKFAKDGSAFTVTNPNASYLYFPITNGFDLLGSITPTLNGDIKLDQNHFALLPVSQEDLQNSPYGRHFWLNIANYGLYNASGVSARQKIDKTDEVTVEGGFLYQTITRKNQSAGVEVSMTTFAPFEDENIELTKVTIKNCSNAPLTYTPTVAIPLFSRSADNLRDHRHVTAILNRSQVVQNGITSKPTLAFDERGHVLNTVSYGVFVNGEENDVVTAYNPKLQEFVGEGNSLDWPGALLEESIGSYNIGDHLDGFEVIGAMQLNEVTLQVEETHSYVFAVAIDEKEEGTFDHVLSDYCNVSTFDQLLTVNQTKWQEKLSTFNITTGNTDFDKWVKWVALQPILRRIYGCSFLPHHDYGRGGRGWRDLWQDCLALILMESNEVEYLLYNNFGGVRIDGSNATIIGTKPGEFVADRNNIPRLWMDHGVWPWNTTKLYVERSGDFEFLFKKQRYFKDENTHYAKNKDSKWSDAYGQYQLTDANTPYEGIILEHILVQNLTQFYNVGEHNTIRLEGADWNDGLDMASKKGESVTFTAFYMMNLKQIADMLQSLKQNGYKTIPLYQELLPLIEDEIDYNDIDAKVNVLHTYFDSVAHTLSGEVIEKEIDLIIQSLMKKVDWMSMHLRKQEWLDMGESKGWFNGYYDDRGLQLEGHVNNQTRMTLTGQVFPIMSGLATDEHITKILTSAKEHLYDASVAGYRLNTNFEEVKLDMGRLFGFAYGHKENGAMFSHMAMMFANGLYQRNFVTEGFSILDELSKHCLDFDNAKIYPGIPEYIDPDGRGMYHYLTGSASWFILNVVNEMFGVKGHEGHLYLLPKLVDSQFNQEKYAEITTEFDKKKATIKYINTNNKDYGQYQINKVTLNGTAIDYSDFQDGAIINKNLLTKEKELIIEVFLA